MVMLGIITVYTYLAIIFIVVFSNSSAVRLLQPYSVVSHHLSVEILSVCKIFGYIVSHICQGVKYLRRGRTSNLNVTL